MNSEAEVLRALLSAWKESSRMDVSDTQIDKLIKGLLPTEKLSERPQYALVPFDKLLERSMWELDATESSECIGTGYPWLDDKIVGLFKGELLVLGGESGCLHPKTVIFDPTDNSHETVEQRYKKGKDFNVFSLDDKGDILITRAESPIRYSKTQMYELSNGIEKIIVTAKHRIWTGTSYQQVSDLRESCAYHLPTISESCLSESFSNGQCYSRKDEDSQSDYHLSSRLYGLLLRLVKGIYPKISPSPTDVHGQYCEHFDTDVLDDKKEHNHQHQNACLPSKQDFSNLENKKHQSESQSHSIANNASLFSRILSSVHRFCSCLFRSDKDEYTQKFSPYSTVYKTYLDSQDVLSCFYNTTWAVKQVEDEVYYDFHVPQYENYYACGLFHHNTGKTQFATGICYKAASRGIKTTVLALEDRMEDYGIKATYFELGRLRKRQNLHNYPWNAYRKNEITDSGYGKFREEALKNISSSNLNFVEVKKQMDIDLLERVLSEETAKGTKLFLVDHLHYLDMTAKDNSSRAEWVERMMIRIKATMNRTGARVILVVHYKKLDGKKPLLDSFKDSIAIPQNANYVLNMWRDRSENGVQYETHFYLPKVRNPNGETTIKLIYDPDENEYKDGMSDFGTPQEETKQMTDKIDF